MTVGVSGPGAPLQPGADPSRPVPWREKWSLPVLLKIGLYLALCFIAVDLVPNTIWDPELRHVTLLIGALGIWRYLWWTTHAVRATIYGRLVYPRLRRRADAAWDAGWRPRHVHFMMTTHHEDRRVTESVVESICAQLRDMGVPGSIWLGSSNLEDERIIEDYLRLNADDLDLEFTIVRQNQPGKRMAIGLVLRAMSRGGVRPDDIVVFMDGDSVLGEGCVQKCASVFQADPELRAVTTDEEVVCFGPRWVHNWLALRFTQRRIAMQSHSLSSKVLTLTGRMSAFRANHLLDIRFIRLLEADHLNHWLWGDFRFLSGDDKSTWYYMLTIGAKMLYLPDAMVYTVEHVQGSGIARMVQNFRRWSGNMLRNGARAIALGPRRVGFLIWWCLVDQRIAMWTMLVGPIMAVMASTLHTASYLVSCFIWIAVSRMALCLAMYGYSRRVSLAFPFLLYLNQLINAGVKVYCLFRLSKQRWTNRGDQAAGYRIGWGERVREAMASYLTFLYVMALCLAVVTYTRLIELPSLNMTLALLAG